MGSDSTQTQAILTGIWVSGDGNVHKVYREPDNNTTEEVVEPFRGFLWARERDLDPHGLEREARALSGKGPLNRLLETEDFETYQNWTSRDVLGRTAEWIKPFESQHMLRQKERLFDGLFFDDFKRCQVDIETDSDGVHFSNPYKDRILAIGMKMGDQEKLLCLENDDRESEKAMLEEFVATLQEWDPDVIEGHNIFSFDLNYLKIRSQKRKVPVAWGRFGQHASFRKSRLKVAERWVDFQRCDIPGRTVFDTYLMVQLYDVTTRDMPAYGLKAVAKYFGVTRKLDHERTYIEGSSIHKQFRENREEFLEYLRDDLLETEGVAAILLPTYFEQCKAFPVLLQEACLRGTSSKIDLLFFEKYFHANHALPMPAEGFSGFEGGYTRSFEDGVFKHVLHYDVASLYPSLLLKINENPWPDDLGVFFAIAQGVARIPFKIQEPSKD